MDQRSNVAGIVIGIIVMALIPIIMYYAFPHLGALNRKHISIEVTLGMQEGYNIPVYCKAGDWIELSVLVREGDVLIYLLDSASFANFQKELAVKPYESWHVRSGKRVFDLFEAPKDDTWYFIFLSESPQTTVVGYLEVPDYEGAFFWWVVVPSVVIAAIMTAGGVFTFISRRRISYGKGIIAPQPPASQVRGSA